MNREKVISREYKLGLKKKNFSGDESKLLENAERFWTSFTNISLLECSGSLKKIDAKREIRFYDTDDLTLFHNDYIFRERKEGNNGKKEITLKFRHRDRYTSEDRYMLPGKIGKGKRKFEEDIKAEFQTLFSHSSSQSCNQEQKFELLKDISKFYPGIEKDLHHFDKGEKLKLVNDKEIKEFVITGGNILLDKKSEIKAECALIVWFDIKKIYSDPLIVEFSFRYGSKKAKYDSKVSKKVYDLFLNIQKQMQEFLDQSSNTKTGLLYNR